MTTQAPKNSSIKFLHPPALRLAALTLTAGVLHFIRPEFFDKLIPPELPGKPRPWTYGSGAVELAVGSLLLLPRTRSLGGLLAAWLFIAVLPGNLHMVRLWWKKPLAYKALAIARVPLQIPLVTEARKVYRSARFHVK
ncbi:MAG: DoxX family protein [Mycobacteriaceae bacterium]